MAKFIIRVIPEIFLCIAKFPLYNIEFWDLQKNLRNNPYYEIRQNSRF